MTDKSKQNQEEKNDQQTQHAENTTSSQPENNQEKNRKEEEDDLNNTEQESTKNDKASDKKEKKKNNKKEKKKDSKETKIQELGEQVDKLNDRYLRLQAEFDNYRKRTIRERADLLKSAGEDVLKDILPVIDDMDRAMETIEKAEDIEAIKAGMKLIDQKFSDFIKQQGVFEIEAMHQEFDTDVHEAVTKIPAPKEELKGKVVDVIQKGYKLNDKVIRFAKVVIGE